MAPLDSSVSGATCWSILNDLCHLSWFDPCIILAIVIRAISLASQKLGVTAWGGAGLTLLPDPGVVLLNDVAQ